MAIAFSTKIINIIIFVYVVLYEQSLIQKYISMEKSIKGTKTEQNLLKAFAGESQARSRYTFFASVAKKEGFEQIAAVFSETADQELEHAKRFFKFLEGGMLEIQASYPAGKIGTTAENLLAAAEGENEEWSLLYPEFAKIAQEEGFPQVATAFKMIAKVEAEHEARYRTLLERVIAEKVFEREEDIEWQCRNCGYVHKGKKALENCPACNHPKSYFEPKKNNY
jgi:rubrerythrin